MSSLISLRRWSRFLMVVLMLRVKQPSQPGSLWKSDVKLVAEEETEALVFSYKPPPTRGLGVSTSAPLVTADTLT